MNWLYRSEAKGIQQWLLASQKLREIAGGSSLVERLAEEARKALESSPSGKSEWIEQAAAGGLTIRFPDKASLAAFARKWPQRVDDLAPGLPMIQAWVECDGRDEWDRLQRRLGEERNRAFPRLPEAGPLLLRAAQSGLPAVSTTDGVAQDRGMSARSGEAGSKKDATLTDRLVERLLPEDAKAGVRYPEDVDELSAGYVAVVHLDANGVGRVLSRTGDGDRVVFSQTLSKATTAAARAFLEAIEVERDGHGDSMRPCRPVVLGGDDFTILCRAEDALGATTNYLREFEAKTRDIVGSGEGLTACAGIAFVKPGWPFHAAHELAEELCRAAKAGHRGSPRSALAFHRVTTALSASWDEIVREELTQAGTGRLLTRNPYSLADVDGLLSLVRRARELPRGSLRRWVGLAREDAERAGQAWSRMQEIVKKRSGKEWADFTAALRSMDVDPDTGWSESGEKASGPLRDVVELISLKEGAE